MESFSGQSAGEALTGGVPAVLRRSSHARQEVGWALAALSGVTLLLALLPGRFLAVDSGVDLAALHAALAMVSLGIAVAILVTGWISFDGRIRLDSLAIISAFLGVVLLSLVHLMLGALPEIVTPARDSLHGTAGLLVAGGILAAAFFTRRAVVAASCYQWLAAIAGVLLAAILDLVILATARATPYWQAHIVVTVFPGLILLLYAWGGWRLYAQLGREPRPELTCLLLAAAAGLFGQLLMGLRAGDAGAYVLIGDFFGIGTFTLVYRAIFHQVASGPYAEVRAAQRRASASESRFQSLLELSSDWYWEQDKDLRFTFTSKPSVLAGFDPIGKLRWELPFAPDFSSESWQEHKTVLSARKPFRDLVLPLPDAKLGMRYVSISGEPVFGAQKAFLGYHGVTTDVTQRILAEQAVRDSERLARAMIDGLSASICVLDEHGTVVSVNKAWEDYYRENRGEPFYSSVGVNYPGVCEAAAGNPYADAMAAGLRGVLRGEAPRFSLEYPCENPLARRWFLAEVMAIPGAGPLKAVVAHHNITLIKQAELMLAVEKQVHELLAANISLADVLEALCRGFERISTGRFAAWLVDTEGVHLRRSAAPSLPATYVEAIDGLALGEHAGACGAAAYRRTPVFCTDIATHPLWDKLRDLAQLHGLRSAWSLPLLRGDAEVLGAIEVYFDTPRPPDEEERQLLDRAGRLAAMAVERTRAEDRRRLIAEVFAGSREGIMISDAANRIVMVNGAFTSITGYSAGEALGRSPRLLSSGLQGEAFYRQLWSAVGSLGYWRGEIWDRRKNGDYYCEHMSISTVRNNRGEITHHVAIFADVTDRKRIEETLRASEMLLRLIVDNMPAMIGYYDAELNCRFANLRQAKICGLAPADMAGVNLSQIVGPDNLAAMLPFFERARAGETVRFEGPFFSTADGQVFEVSLVPDIGAGGVFLGCYVMCSDVTERNAYEAQVVRMNTELEKRVEQRTRQLAAANKELASFSYSVSHDLQAPLRRIDRYAQMLNETSSARLDDAGRNMLTRIHEASAQTKRLIADLLRLAHTTRIELHTGIVDVSALARDVIDQIGRADSPARPVEVTIEPGITIDADEAMLRILLDNLLGNAWKFTGKTDQPRIRVGALDAAQGQGFYVEDNGAGFDMRYAYKLFGAFQRLHNQNEFKGTGVGLAIVQRIANVHGWRIEATSEIGRGATFKVIMQ